MAMQPKAPSFDWDKIAVWGVDSAAASTESRPAAAAATTEAGVSRRVDLPEQDWNDLVDTVIAEAGGEGPDGMAAVTHVIRNRADRRGQGIGDVVRAPNQFEGYGNPRAGSRRNQRDPAFRKSAEDVIDRVFAGELEDPTGGADHFHAAYVSPDWAGRMPETARVGGHIFYNSGQRRRAVSLPDEGPVPSPRPDASGEEQAMAYAGEDTAPASRFDAVLRRNDDGVAGNPEGKGLARLAPPEQAAPAGTGGALHFNNAGQDAIKPGFRAILEDTSRALGRDLTITSGYRSPQHRVERSKKTGPGEHSRGHASDISMAGMSVAERRNLVRELQARGVKRFGLYKNSPNMLHVDMKDQTGQGSNWFMYDRSNRNLHRAPQWFQDVSRAPAPAAVSVAQASGEIDWTKVPVFGRGEAVAVPEDAPLPSPRPADAPDAPPAADPAEARFEAMEAAEPGRYALIDEAGYDSWRREWEAAQPGLLEDVTRLFGGSIVEGVGHMVRGIGAFGALYARPTVEEIVNPIFGTELEIGNPLGGVADTITGAGAGIKEGISASTRKAIAASTPDGDLLDPSTWTLGENPNLRGYTALALDVLGSMVPVLAASVVAGPSGAIVVGGAQGGGAAEAEAHDLIDAMARDGVLEEESGYYREQLAAGRSPDEALAATKQAAGQVAFLLTAPVSALGGGTTSKIIDPATHILAGRNIAVRIAGRAGLSALEEGAQEAAEQVTTRAGVNIGAQADLSVTEGTFGDFVLGALGGAAPGAVAGGLSGRVDAPEPEEAAPAPRADPIIGPAYPTEPPPAPRGPLGRSMEHGARREAQRGGGTFTIDDPAIGDMPASPTHGAVVRATPAPDATMPQRGATVRVDAPDIEPFMATVEGHDGNEILVFDSASGEVFQIPTDYVTKIAEDPATIVANDPALEPAPPAVGVVRSQLPPATEDKPVTGIALGAPEPGDRVIVEAEGLGRVAGRLERYEGDEAIVVGDDGVPVQVPTSALRMSRLTSKEVDAAERKANPPVTRAVSTAPAVRQVFDAQIEMPDEKHARLYDLGRLRRDSTRTLGAGKLDLDAVDPTAQRRLAAEFGVSERALGQIADDYRYRIERAARSARSNAPQKVRPVNPKLLKRMGAEQVDAAAASADSIPAIPDGAMPQAGADRAAADAAALDALAHEAATSPLNGRPEPTEAQKEAGNYTLGHVRLGGLDLSIENPAGSTRSGASRSGRPWSVTMQSHYGYIRGTTGRDKDHVDIFVKPGTAELADDAPIFVVDQKDPARGRFDEHKVMAGFGSEAEARKAYLANYTRGWKGLGAITATTLAEFKGWLADGDTAKPFTERSGETGIMPIPERAPAAKGDDFDAIWKSRDFAPLRRGEPWARGAGGPHRESEVARDLVAGWSDGHGGRVDLARLGPLRTENLRNQFDPINPYAIAAYYAATSRLEEIRASNTGLFFDGEGKPRSPVSDAPSLAVVEEASPAEAGPIPKARKKSTARPRKQDEPASEWGAENRLVSRDRAEELRRRLKDRLNRVGAGIDPEILAIGTELAAFHIEAGARRFGDFARVMIADLGDKARPYLKSWYMAVKYDPRAAAFEGMSTVAEVDASDENASFDQAATDRVPMVAGQSRDSAQRVPLGEQSFESLDVDLQRRVHAEVLASLNDPQIFQTIVSRVPVDVMNMLTGKEWTTSGFLRNPAVLRSALAIPLNLPVPARGKFIDAVAAARQSVAGAVAIGRRANPDVGGPAAKSGAALTAGEQESRQKSRRSIDDGVNVPQGQEAGDGGAETAAARAVAAAQADAPDAVPQPPASTRTKPPAPRIDQARSALRAAEKAAGKPSAKRRIAEGILGADVGDIVVASADIDYSQGGHPYRIEAMERSGAVRVVDPVSGAGTTWAFADLLRARNAGVTFAVAQADEIAASGEAAPSLPQSPPVRSLGLPRERFRMIAASDGLAGLARLRAHPDYAAAKAGDPAAAARLVRAIVDPTTVSGIRKAFGRDVVFAAPFAREADGLNAIPGAFSRLLATSIGASAETGIVQISSAFHTGARALDRLLGRPVFDGPVEAGRRYVLVDDVTVMGGTLAEMANHIRAAGGDVVGAVALVNRSRHGIKGAPRQHVRLVEERYGDLVRQEFGIDPAALTGDEAIAILNAKDADTLRGRIAAAKGERERRLLQKGVRAPGPEGRLTADGDNTPALTEADAAAILDIIRDVAGLSGALFARRITLPQGASGWGVGAPVTAEGFYDPVQDAIAISLADGGVRTAYHEAFHRLQNLFLSGGERAVLKAELGRLRRIVRSDPGRRSQADAMSGKEIEAEAFAIYASGRSPVQPHRTLRAAWDRIAAMLRRVRNYLAGRGFRTVEDVFDAARSGEVARRSPATGRNGRGVEPSIKALAGGGRRFLDEIRGKATDWTPALLALVPLNYFEELKRPNMTAVDDYMRVKRLMDAYRGKKHAAMDEVAQEWRKYARLGRGPLAGSGKARAAELAGLMHDATLAGIDPSKTDAETSGQPGYAELRKRFTAMPQAGRDLFEKVRDIYRAQSDEMDSILLDNVRKAQEIAQRKVEKDYRRELADIARSGLKPDARKEAEEKAARKYKDGRLRAQYSMKARLTRLRQVFESSRVPEPYFPLARFGRYFVSVQDVDGSPLSFSLREHAADRDRLAAALRKEFPAAEVKVGVMDEKASARDAMDPRLVAEMEKIVGGMGLDKEATARMLDQLWQGFLHTLPDLSVRKRHIHRKGVAGFEGDALRAFASHMFHAAHQMGRLKYGLELTELVNEAVDQAKEADDPTRAVTLTNELRKRHDWVMNPQGSKLAQGITSAMFVWYLAATPAAAIVNLSQTPMLGIPILGARLGGMGKAAAALTRASADLVRGRGTAALPPDEKRAMAAFFESGLIDRSQAHDLAGVGEVGVEYSPVRARVMAAISWAFHNAEVANRSVTGLAAYRMARAQGQNETQAIYTAHQLVHTVHFDYSNSSRARVLQSDPAKVIAVFQSYQLNMWYRLVRDIHQSFKGETAQARKEARYQLAGISAMMSLMGGVTGMFGYNVVMTLLGALFGDDDDPFTFQDNAQKAVVDLLGPDIGGMVLKGVPGHLMGINLTSRIGMPDFFIRAPDATMEGRDWFLELMVGMFGVVPSTMESMYDGYSLIREGRLMRGVEVAAPKAVKDLMKAYRYMNEGVLTRRGDTVVARENLGAWDFIATAIGFTPAQIAETYERNNALRGAEKRILDRRRELMNRFALAHAMGDEETENRVLEAIERFNRVPIHHGVAITSDTLRQSLRTRARSAEQREDGLLIQNRHLGHDLRARMPERVH